MVNEMGIETIAILGLAAFKAVSTINKGKDEARSVIDKANLDAANKSKEVRYRAARQQLSFLNSGLTLEGTPMAAIQGTFSTGIQDINQITSNANKTAKNIISSSRTDALFSLATSAAGASFGSGSIFGGQAGQSASGGLFGEFAQGSASRAIEFGSVSTQGPIQGFGGFGGYSG